MRLSHTAAAALGGVMILALGAPSALAADHNPARHPHTVKVIKCVKVRHRHQRDALAMKEHKRRHRRCEVIAITINNIIKNENNSFRHHRRHDS